MAKAAKKPDAPADPLEKEANDRLKEARRGKSSWVLDFKECYFFTAPQRQRQITSESTPGSAPIGDAPELFTSAAYLITQDFITEVVNTYMPEAQQWCERGRGMFITEEVFGQVSEQVRADDKQIFVAMKASNLYSEIQKAFYPDLAIGTCALWVDQPRAAQPISVKAIPLRELEIALGPDGEVDDRFAVRYTKNCYVRSLLPGIELPADVATEIDENPAKSTQIVWGFWRKWDRVDDEVWQHTVMVKDKKVHDELLIGEGCCPLLVPRFNPSADWAFALGPLIQGLPDFRQIDELERQRIENGELHLSPPITYPDDSFTAIENGLEPGKAYPIRAGSEGAVKAIYQAQPPDAANYVFEEKLRDLRKLFFVDLPEQRGDTPPTLGQWLDEMARAQRRIGTPGAPFYREGPAKIFLRFKYLLEKVGVIKPVVVDGRHIALLPYNPAQRAAEQQEIATNVQALQILSQIFPEEFKVRIDGFETAKAIIDKMRASLIKFRDDGQIQQAIAQISQLVKGKLGDPGGQGGGDPGTTPRIA